MGQAFARWPFRATGFHVKRRDGAPELGSFLRFPERPEACVRPWPLRTTRFHVKPLRHLAPEQDPSRAVPPHTTPCEMNPTASRSPEQAPSRTLTHTPTPTNMKLPQLRAIRWKLSYRAPQPKLTNPAQILPRSGPPARQRGVRARDRAPLAHASYSAHNQRFRDRLNPSRPICAKLRRNPEATLRIHVSMTP